MSHTPGPWMVHQQGSMRACDGRHTTREGCRTLAEAEIIGVPRAEAEANARLIATAPELLAALRFALAGELDDHRRAAGEAAIAKAEGHQ